MNSKNEYGSQPGKGVAHLVQGSQEQRIVQSCIDTIDTFFDIRLKQFFEAVSEDLFIEARDAQSDLVQAEYFDAMQEMKHVSKPLQQAFLGKIMDDMKALGVAEKRLPKPNIDDSSLSLVDTLAMNDMLSIQRILEKAVPRYEEPVLDISEQLNRVTGINIDQHNNPVGVNNVCVSFHDALQNLGVSNVARKALFKAFDALIVNELEELYSVLDELFSKSDFLPAKQPRKYVVNKQPEKRAIKKPKFLVDPDAIAGESSGKVEPSQTILHQEEVARDAWGRGDSEARVEHGNLPENDILPDTNIPNHSAYNTAQSLFSLTGQRTEKYAESNFSTEAIVKAISGLQHQLADTESKNIHQRIKVKDALNDVLLQTSGQKVGIQSKENEAIEFVSRIMDALLDDILVSSGIKDRLVKLEALLLKLALLDDQFLQSENHPARKFINVLSRIVLPLTPDSDEEDVKVAGKLDKLIEHVNSEYQSDSNLFKIAKVELDEIVNAQSERYAKNLSRVISECENEQDILNFRAESDSDAVSDNIPELEASIARVQRINIGDYVQVTTKGNLKIETLSWTDPEKTRFVFVDRKGNRALTSTQKELAVLFKKGNIEIFSDVSSTAIERGIFTVFREMQEQVTFKATHSKLTGLPNEKVFIKKLEESLKNTRLNDSEHVLCYIQLDDFENIIEKTGKKLADGLLKNYAGVLEKYFNTYGYIGQIDKTSFAVLLENKKLDTGTQIADKHRYSIFKSRVKWKGDTLPISVSIGNVLLDRHSQQAEVELKSALIACRKASSDGGNRTQQYQPGTAHLIAKDCVDWSTAIPRALEENKVALFRQQIVPINGDDSKAGHYEILFRLIDLEGNALAPFQFIQAAERTGHMPMVDRWIIKNTLKWMTDNPELLKEVSGYAINLSGLTLSDESLMSDVFKMLDESGVASEKILFEVTETVEIDSLSIAIDFIHALRERGCRFCLDDFGTGLSSYAYLKQLPVDYVKIDGLFVKDILDNENDRAMVKSINEISHYMGKKTIAEFVENDEVVAVLKEIGIDYVQGFGIHKPSILPES